MNRSVMLAQKSKRHRRFGHIGSIATQKDTDHPVTLIYLGFQREGGGRRYTLYEGGRWQKNEQVFRTDEDITLHYKVLGDRGGYLLGTHVSAGVESFLFIRPIKSGDGSFVVRIPQSKMVGMRFALTHLIPSDVDASNLTIAEREHVSRNALSLTLNQRPLALSPTLGNLGFIPPEMKTGSAKGRTETGRDFWDGKLDQHSFIKHGYTGKTSIFEKSGGPTKPVGPHWVSYATALHAFRGAYYVAEHYDDNKFGWNAVEKPNYRMGAGIPMALVGQMIYHDDDSVVGSIAFGKSKRKHKTLQGIDATDQQMIAWEMQNANLSGWYSKTKKKAKKAYKKTKEVVSKAVDTVVPEVRLPGNPQWHWSSGKVRKDHLWFSSLNNAVKEIIPSEEDTRLNAQWPGGTVINAKIPPTAQYRIKLSKNHAIKEMANLAKTDPEAGKAGETNGNWEANDIRRLAVKVEWYHPGQGKWILGRHPPYDIPIKGSGKFVVFFRFCRQLSSKDPDVKHYDGFKLGPNSRNRGTAHCYPSHNNQRGISYRIVGRPLEIIDGEKKTVKVEMADETLQGVQDYSGVVACLQRGDHNSIHIHDVQTIAITDVEKQAYLSQPNFTNIFWKEGEFSPGCKLVVIGQSLGGWQHHNSSHIALTTKKGALAKEVYQETYHIKRTDKMAGSKTGDLLKIIDVITTEDLLDDIDLTFNKRAIEANVKSAWREVFDIDLSPQWFFDLNAGLKDTEGNTIPGLDGADPENPLNYIVSLQGQQFSFPYSIAIVEVPNDWVGPVLDFEEVAGDFITTENSLKEDANGNAYVYLVGTNSLKYDVEQRVNLSGEIKEQLAALAEGKSPLTTMMTAGQIPDKMVEVSHQAFHERHQKPYEEMLKEDTGDWGIFDFLRPKPFETDSKIRAKTLWPVGTRVPLGGLSGMDKGTHTLTDVSSRYAGDRITELGELNLSPRVKGPRTDIQEIYMVNPNEATSPQLGWVTGNSRPRPTQRRVPVRVPQFGSAYNSSNLAKQRGHIMSQPNFRRGRR